MASRNAWTLFAALAASGALVAACSDTGSSVVGGTADTATDRATDVAVDAPQDVALDTSMDTSLDAP